MWAAGVLDDVEIGGWNVSQVVPFILHWAALRAAPGFDLPAGLDDPFEPLIRPPMTDFTTGALDEIDRAGSLAQFGYVVSPLE